MAENETQQAPSPFTLQDLGLLFADQRKDLVNSAYHVVRNAEDAADAVQNVFEKMTRLTLKGEIDPERVSGLPTSDLRFKTAEILRGRQRKPEEVFTTLTNEQDEEGYDQTIPGPINTEEQALQDEQSAAFNHAIASLDPRKRAIFIARFVDGIPSKEIAGELQTTTSAIDTLVWRAKIILRDKLRELQEEAS